MLLLAMSSCAVVPKQTTEYGVPHKHVVLHKEPSDKK